MLVWVGPVSSGELQASAQGAAGAEGLGECPLSLSSQPFCCLLALLLLSTARCAAVEQRAHKAE